MFVVLVGAVAILLLFMVFFSLNAWDTVAVPVAICFVTYCCRELRVFCTHAYLAETMMR